MALSSDPGIWAGAIMCLFLFSILAKDNPGYRLAENVFVGINAGIAVSVAVTSFRSTVWAPFTGGKYVLAVPIVLGLLLYTNYVPSISHYNRASLALLIGSSAGVAIRGLIGTQIVAQISATFLNLTSNTLNGLIIVLSTLAALSYFLLTMPGSKGYGVLSKAGRYCLMVAFGAQFGNTVMARVSSLIGTVTLIVKDWLGVGLT